MIPDNIDLDGFCASFDVSRETRAKLEAYDRLLVKWQGAINLIGPRTLQARWCRHYADSAQLLPFLNHSGPILDFGSGAGFPGLVLAILAGRETHLVESDTRKAAFLGEVSRETRSPVTIHAKRAGNVKLPEAGTITARALAPLSELFEMTAHFAGPDTIWVFPKGRAANVELTDARSSWNMEVKQAPSRTDAQASILQITSLTRRS